MSFTQIYLAENEMDASIKKGLLESFGIKSKISPVNGKGGRYNPYFESFYGVYVEEEKAEEAKKVLAERNQEK